MDIDLLVQKATHFSTHSGEVTKDGIFVALKGDKIDGHDFVEEALRKNVLAVFVERDVGIKDSRIVEVTSTHEIHWEIASRFRKKYKGIVVGVGGSNGKTSTKDFLYQILSPHFICIRTEKSQNGKLGLPKTLEKLRPEVEVAIIEIGTDAPGDMEQNVGLVQPCVGVLTSIGEEHLNLLENLEGVFQEEKVLADFILRNKAKFYCPEKDPYLCKLKSMGANLTPPKPEDIDARFRVEDLSLHALQNLSLAISVAQDLGVTTEQIMKSLKNISLPDGRGAAWQVRKDLIVLRDHYNANPSSMRAALKSALQSSQVKGLKLKLILGDMLDLGAESDLHHEKIFNEALALRPSIVLCVGPQFSKYAKLWNSPEVLHINHSKVSLNENVLNEFRTSGLVLAKGSRGTQVENILNKIYGEFRS
jgi:UDP-N-acetylmuramoyl-tripeptide--D-alanyl-D-alanine ligase